MRNHLQSPPRSAWHLSGPECEMLGTADMNLNQEGSETHPGTFCVLGAGGASMWARVSDR